MLDETVAYTFTAPASVDGRGEVAVLNDSTSANFVGRVLGITRSVEVRPAEDAKNQAHGVLIGDQWYGHATHTFEVEMALATTWALTFARRQKLWRATNAMAADLSVAFTETGGVAKTIAARREQYPSGPDKERKVLIALVSADPRIYKVSATTGSSPLTNTGDAPSPPTFTINPSGSPVQIQNTTTGEVLSLLVGAGYLTSGVSATINFGAKTVTQSGTLKPQAVDYPASKWWEMVPGSNAFAVSNVSSSSVSFLDAWI